MTEVEIREYLQNYRDRKTIADYKAQNGRRDDRDVVCIQAIENCMRLLPDGLGDILRMHYIERKSLRKIATDSGIFFGCTISRENPCGRSQRSISIVRTLLPSAGTRQ